MPMCCSQSLVLKQSLRLSQSQRLQLQTQTLSLRLELIEALRGERFEPKATCPDCARELTALEIISGFNQDPKDFTTRCTKCGKRFEPKLECLLDSARLELPFFCSAQTLDQMRGKESLTPEQFKKQHPDIFRSALVHHGSLHQAFAKIDVSYPFEEIPDWKEKVRPFLGKLPDTIIAKHVDVAVSAVRKLRMEFGISRFLKSEVVE